MKKDVYSICDVKKIRYFFFVLTENQYLAYFC